MRFLLALVLLAMASVSSAVPLTMYKDYTNELATTLSSTVALMARGMGTNRYYMIEVDPATGAIPVSIVSPLLKTSDVAGGESGVNVATQSVVVAAANPRRAGFVIFNNSSNSVYLTFGVTSVASRCTRLLATFASWEMYGPTVYTGPISAIRNAGSGVVTVFELQGP